MASAPHIVGRFRQRTFDHMVNTQKKGATASVPTRVGSKPTFVQPKDRIALWNISPGDRVRVVSGSMKGKSGTVDYVDRTKNRVFLAETEFCRRKVVPSERKNAIFTDPAYRPNQSVLSQIPIHYSNVALVLQRSPEQEAKDEAEKEGDGPLSEVVAKRLRATHPHYNWKERRWTWKRLAESVSEVDSKSQHLKSVDWSKEDRFTKFKSTPKGYPRSASVLDTLEDTAMQASFVPPSDPLVDQPAELNIRDIEFFNKYSRAKRTKAFNDNKRSLEAADIGFATAFVPTPAAPPSSSSTSFTEA